MQVRAAHIPLRQEHVMEVVHTQPATGKPLVLRSRQQIEEELQRRVADERRRLEGQPPRREPAVHFHRPVERPFTAAERNQVTILFGGLTWKHEWLIRSAFQSAGYKVEIMPVPDVAGFQLGKEFGNNGQCNPTYFMVGHLIKYLQGLEAKGLSREEIINNYVFFTAGSCGPCRFGMYEAEYRLALRNSGFDGFRVLLFQQSGGLSQGEAKAGLEMNLDFFLGILNAMNMGDLINDLVYQIGLYEVHKGEADRVLDECMDLLAEALRKSKPYRLEGKLASFF